MGTAPVTSRKDGLVTISLAPKQLNTQKSLPYHPNVTKKCMNSLIKNFPKAEFTAEVFRKINLATLSLGCTSQNTLFASSVCSDEINHHPNSLNRKLADFFGGCFYMGGLGGLPFVGKTGFKAYSHHVPDNGNVFILFAPHIGFAEDGLVGKIQRANQSHLDSACGAAIGGYNTLKNALIPSTEPPKFAEDKLKNVEDPFDPQFAYIVDALKPKFA